MRLEKKTLLSFFFISLSVETYCVNYEDFLAGGATGCGLMGLVWASVSYLSAKPTSDQKKITDFRSDLKKVFKFQEDGSTGAGEQVPRVGRMVREIEELVKNYGIIPALAINIVNEDSKNGLNKKYRDELEKRLNLLKFRYNGLDANVGMYQREYFGNADNDCKNGAEDFFHKNNDNNYQEQRNNFTKSRYEECMKKMKDGYLLRENLDAQNHKFDMSVKNTSETLVESIKEKAAAEKAAAEKAAAEKAAAEKAAAEKAAAALVE